MHVFIKGVFKIKDKKQWTLYGIILLLVLSLGLGAVKIRKLERHTYVLREELIFMEVELQGIRSTLLDLKGE